MTASTLIRGATNFATSSSTSLTLYNTQSESVTKSANLINLPMPTGDSSSVIVFDLLGVTREISIRGKFTTSDGTITNFTADLDSLVNGSQGATGGSPSQVGYYYTPKSTGVQIRVYVNEVTWDFVAGEPNGVEYSLSLMEVDGSNSG